MKTVLIKIVLVFFALASFTNIYAKNGAVDKGFAGLKIDAKIEDVQNFLVAPKPGQLKSSNASEIGEYITSGWLVDLHKAGVTDFYGLKITQIEVYFNEYDRPEGTGTQDVYCFHVYTAKTATEDDLLAFTDRLTNEYGESMTITSPVGDQLVGMSWFTDLTLMNVNFGINEDTGEELPHYEASFHQAYGG